MEEYSSRRLSKSGLEGTALLIVDPQRDFHEGGSLAVSGAIEDAGRIAQMITSHAEHIDELIVTLDSHHVSKVEGLLDYKRASFASTTSRSLQQKINKWAVVHRSPSCCLVTHVSKPQRLDIAHPMFWTSGDGSGSHPAPFTLITSEDIQQGTWAPVQEEHKVRPARCMYACTSFVVCSTTSCCVTKYVQLPMLGTPHIIALFIVNQPRMQNAAFVTPLYVCRCVGCAYK